MFENSSIFILTESNCEHSVLRLDTDANTQKAICEAFSQAHINLTENKNKIIFDGNYKPHDDEFLSISNFTLADEIKDAIRNPLGVHGYCKNEDKYPDIKAIFVGEKEDINDKEVFRIAFQRFKKEQYISTKPFNLFFENNTFMKETRFGISISDNIDCFYEAGELQFLSFYFARQIFDLSDYYRTATDHEVTTFAASDKLALEDKEVFIANANSWIRRKIAMINDSGVLQDNSASQIKTIAKKIGVSIEVSDNKVVIPKDKEQVKIILGFLDEEAYKGPFSKKTFLANSKRAIGK